MVKMKDDFDYDPEMLTFRKTVSTGLVGPLLSSTLGSLSAISSCVIIFIVWRSIPKLSISYHRIMFFMSVGDVIHSTCLALSTLPMPRDMIYTQFEAPYIGTNATCRAQAIGQLYSHTFTYMQSIVLSIYFYCAINGRVKERNMNRKLELFLTVLTFIVPFIPILCSIMRFDYLNASPDLPFCGYNPSPYWCGAFPEEAACSHYDDLDMYQFMAKVVHRVFLWVVLLFAFGLIILIRFRYRSIRKEEMSDKSSDEVILRRSSQESRVDPESFQPTASEARAMFLLAVGYFICLLITMSGFTVRTILISKSFDKDYYHQDHRASSIYYLATRPLQGFFNMILFIGEKAIMYKLSHEGTKTKDAIKMVLVEPLQQDYIFSGLDSVYDRTIGENDVEIRSEGNADHIDSNKGDDDEHMFSHEHSSVSLPSCCGSDPSAQLSQDMDIDQSGALDFSNNHNSSYYGITKAEYMEKSMQQVNKFLDNADEELENDDSLPLYSRGDLSTIQEERSIDHKD